MRHDSEQNQVGEKNMAATVHGVICSSAARCARCLRHHLPRRSRVCSSSPCTCTRPPPALQQAAACPAHAAGPRAPAAGRSATPWSRGAMAAARATSKPSLTHAWTERRRRRTGSKWVNSVPSIWRNGTNPHLRGIFPTGFDLTCRSLQPNVG